MDLDNRHIVEQTANFYRMALATGLTAHGFLTRQVSKFQLVVEMEISLPIKFENLKFALRMGNARNVTRRFSSPYCAILAPPCRWSTNRFYSIRKANLISVAIQNLLLNNLFDFYSYRVVSSVDIRKDKAQGFASF